MMDKATELNSTDIGEMMRKLQKNENRNPLLLGINDINNNNPPSSDSLTFVNLKDAPIEKEGLILTYNAITGQFFVKRGVHCKTCHYSSSPNDCCFARYSHVWWAATTILE
jgi:hypothetical protein